MASFLAKQLRHTAEPQHEHKPQSKVSIEQISYDCEKVTVRTCHHAVTVTVPCHSILIG
jgi:hypothetical protein